MNYSGALDNSEPLISPSNLKFISHSHSTATSQDKALLICTETCCQVPPDIQILPPVSFTPKLNSTIISSQNERDQIDLNDNSLTELEKEKEKKKKKIYNTKYVKDSVQEVPKVNKKKKTGQKLF